jgi:glycosyltransferase involved in cell wall biosynthesis
MDKVLRQPEWAKSLGENLSRHVAANFSWQKATDGYLALLNPSKAQS